jgi:hypothetical protein
MYINDDTKNQHKHKILLIFNNVNFIRL